jgi:aldose 1-epimerase
LLNQTLFANYICFNMNKNQLIAFVVFVSLLVGCTSSSTSSETLQMLDTTALKGAYSKLVGNQNTSIYFLRNSNNVTVAITNYGGRMVALIVPDKNGLATDIVLGYDSVDHYLNKPEAYFGAIIGRYGNRIANARFTLKDTTYRLAANNGPNSLHGGPTGFHNQVWTVNSHQANQLILSYLAKDGEEGYPGNLMVKVTYTLTDANELKMEYEATTDKTTVVNLTNHAYYNLNGQGDSTITDHELNIFASNFSAVDSTLIPVGAPVPVKETPFDFTRPKLIGRDIAVEHIQIKNGLGYDHNFVLDKKIPHEMVKAAVVYAPRTGILMEVFTTEPAIQFYSGNFLDGNLVGKKNKKYSYRSAFCLETQHFPDAPNQPDFPSTELEPGKKYITTTIYKFGIKNN